MEEISLEGEKYKGVFNGDKLEERDPGSYVDDLSYEGAALIQYRSNNKRYFFRFFMSQDLDKPTLKESLKESLESLCVHSKGFDSLCESIIPLIKKFEKENQIQIPEIDLSIE